MSSSTCTCVNNNTFLQLKPAVESPPSLPRVPNRQKGIVSILGGGGAAAPSSIRRTLSADTSSKNWLSQNGSIIKKREEEEDDDDDDGGLMKRPGQDEVWKSIQAQKKQGVVNGDGDHKPIRSSVSWSAVLLSNQKVVDQDSPPYVHPLLKKSSSTLSKQSLQICTESLGSETGSDCLSSHTPHSHHIQYQVQDKEEDIFNDVKINYSKKPPSFPPPLPSLANSNVQLRSHRQGGGDRLILEAVSIPQRNCFHAERSDGRLLLTALKSPGGSHEEAEDDETEEFNIEEVDNSNDNGSEEEEDDEEAALSQLAEAGQPIPATTASLNTNTNHLYWKKQQEGLIPLLRSCKEARRSLLTWDSNYCIATS